MYPLTMCWWGRVRARTSCASSCFIAKSKESNIKRSFCSTASNFPPALAIYTLFLAKHSSTNRKDAYYTLAERACSSSSSGSVVGLLLVQIKYILRMAGIWGSALTNSQDLRAVLVVSPATDNKCQWNQQMVLSKKKNGTNKCNACKRMEMDRSTACCPNFADTTAVFSTCLLHLFL